MIARVGRRVRAAALVAVVAALAACTSSSPEASTPSVAAHPPPPKPAWSVDTRGGRQVAAVDGRAYVVGTTRLTAYDLASGEQIWRVPIERNEAWGSQIAASSDSLVVSASVRANGGTGRRSRAVLLIDPATGRTTGKVAGEWDLFSSGALGEFGDVTVLTGPTDLRGVDRSGRLLWKRKDDAARRLIGCGSDLLVFQSHVDGRLTAISAQTGEDRWRGVPGTRFTTPIWCDDEFVVAEAGRQDKVIVLDRSSGEVRSITGPTRIDEGSHSVVDGVLLASEPTEPRAGGVDSDDRTTTWAYDLRDGNALLWTRTGESCPPAITDLQDLGGRRVLITAGRGCRTRARIVDLATGTIEASTGRPLWSAFAGPAGATTVLLRSGGDRVGLDGEGPWSIGLHRQRDLAEVWSMPASVVEPVVATDGTTIVALADGRLAAYPA